MRIGEKSCADERPQRLEIRKIFAGSNKYELTLNEDIVENQIIPEDGQDPRTEYIYRTLRSTMPIDGYETLAAALIALKYSFADEFSLMRKGQADSSNEEYTAYLNFVEECKTFAKTQFPGSE